MERDRFTEECGDFANPDRVQILARAMELEHRIEHLEHQLFGGNPGLKVVETSLFIDAPFHQAAVIMGEPEYPERMFSHEGWAGWLEGRSFAREYGDQALTPDFMVELNQRLLQRVDPFTAGIIRKDDARGGTFIGGRLAPIVCTADQIQAIQDNPFLDFCLKFPDDDPEMGFIHYRTPPEAVEQELQLLCDEFNQARSGNVAAYGLAAWLQRQFVSVHPFEGSGRESRVLMNWVLENQGLAPSAPKDFDMDILVSQEEWGRLVLEGSRLAMLAQVADGQTDPVVLLGLEEAKARYDSGQPGYTHRAPMVLSYGSGHDRLRYKSFLDIAKARTFTKYVYDPDSQNWTGDEIAEAWLRMKIDKTHWL
jgi:hypothetical protein